LVLDPARGRVGEKGVPTIFVEPRLLAISNVPAKLSRLGGLIGVIFFTGLEGNATIFQEKAPNFS